MEFSMKLHRHPDESILAICDASILGQTFRQGALRLEVSEHFYGGDTVSETEAVTSMHSFSNINLCGNEIVDLAISEGIINPASVVTIGGVKHAQAVTM